MNGRRAARGVLLIATLIVAAWIASGAVEAQAPDASGQRRVYMVGPVADVKSFKQRLEELGHTGTQTIDLQFRLLASGEPAGRAFVNVTADVIVAEGAPALIAAMQATRGIPIVMLNVPLPVEMGFVKSIDHPGSRVTGIAPDALAAFASRLALLKETFPEARKVVALGHRTYSRPGSYTASSNAAAEGLGLSIQSIDVRDADVASACTSFVKNGQQAVVVLLETFPIRRRILDCLNRIRLPAIYPMKEFVSEGGLMSFGPDRNLELKGAADYVSRILKGQVVNTLPVQTAVQTEIVVNVKAAKELGVTIPPSVLSKATQIIK